MVPRLRVVGIAHAEVRKMTNDDRPYHTETSSGALLMSIACIPYRKGGPYDIGHPAGVYVALTGEDPSTARTLTIALVIANEQLVVGYGAHNAMLCDR